MQKRKSRYSMIFEYEKEFELIFIHVIPRIGSVYNVSWSCLSKACCLWLHVEYPDSCLSRTYCSFYML